MLRRRDWMIWGGLPPLENVFDDDDEPPPLVANDESDDDEPPPLVAHDVDVELRVEGQGAPPVDYFYRAWWEYDDDEIIIQPDVYPYYIPYYYSDEEDSVSASDESRSWKPMLTADIAWGHVDTTEMEIPYKTQAELDQILGTEQRKFRLMREVVHNKEQMMLHAQRWFEEVLAELFPEEGFMRARGCTRENTESDPESTRWIRALWKRNANVAQRFASIAKMKATTHSYLMDSGCSITMSGVLERVLQFVKQDSTDLGRVKFGNGDELDVTSEGMNADCVPEIIVKGMPPDRTLCCAYHYAREGFILMTGHGGSIYRAGDDEMARLMEFLTEYTKFKTLFIEDQVYMMLEEPGVDASDTVAVFESAAAQTKFFNSRLAVSSAEELVQVYAMMGFSIKFLRTMVKKGVVDGVDPRLTAAALNSFERKYGANADPWILGSPWVRNGLVNAVDNVDDKADKVGHVEMDVFVMPFLEDKAVDGRRKPVPCLGGGLYLYLAVDKYSHCVWGAISTGLKNPVRMVDKMYHDHYAQHGNAVEKIIADQGVNSQSMYQIGTGEVMLWCQRKNVKVRLAEAYNHQNGTAMIEGIGRIIKTFIRGFYQYYIRSPYVWQLGYNKSHIKTLWGEFALHAINVNRLLPHPTIEGKCRGEVHSGERGNIQNYRMLPPCICLVLRRVGQNAEDSAGHFWQYGIYVGGSKTVKGAARFAVISGDRLIVVTTTAYTAASEGGGSFLYPVVQKGIRQLSPKSIADLEEEARQKKLDAATVEGQEVVKTDNNALNEVSDVLCDVCGNAVTLPNAIVATIGEGGFVCADVGAQCEEARVADGGEAGQADEAAAESEDDEIVDDLHVDAAGILPGRTASVKTWVNGAHGQIFDGIIVRVNAEKRTVDMFYDDGDTERDKPWKMLRGFDDRVERVNIDAEYLQRFDSIEVEGARGATKKNRAAEERQVESSGRDAEILPLADERRVIETAPAIPAAQAPHTRARTRAAAQGLFADWSRVTEDSVWFSFTDGEVLKIKEPNPSAPDMQEKVAQAMSAVFSPGSRQANAIMRKNVPRSWGDALKSQEWGGPARAEWEKLVDTKSISMVSQETADELVRKGAQLLYLFPLYEVKEREGVVVYKVRLVADGARQSSTESVYSGTPSREEFLVIMHLFAAYDFEFAMLDEVRAFLNAGKASQEEILVRLRGDPERRIFQVLKALYGLKGSPRDYSLEVRRRFIDLGFRQLVAGSQCVYFKICGEIVIDGTSIPNLVLMFHHVDDFIVGALKDVMLVEELADIVKSVAFTAPKLNGGKFLGVGVTRYRGQLAIGLDMEDMIISSCAEYEVPELAKPRTVPLLESNFVVTEEDLDALKPDRAKFLERSDISIYMGMVGSLIWISTVRFDIKFAVMYLSWFCQKPRQHHAICAFQLFQYLKATASLPLLLGGQPPIIIVGSSDFSLGTGPQRRGILSYLARLNPQSGAILAKCHTSLSTFTNVFEGELDAHVHVVKVILAVEVMLDQLFIPYSARAEADNLPMQNYVMGDASVKNSKHMEIRLWFARDQFRMGKYEFEHVGTDVLTADINSKPLFTAKFVELRADLMGLYLVKSILSKFVP